MQMIIVSIMTIKQSDKIVKINIFNDARQWIKIFLKFKNFTNSTQNKHFNIN